MDDPDVRTLVATEIPVAGRRMADHYLHVAELADRAITPHRYRIALVVTTVPDRVPDVERASTATTWLRLHEDTLVDVVEMTLRTGLSQHCWQLAHTVRGYYYLTKNWQRWRRTYAMALSAARRSGDRTAEAQIENGLGLMSIESGDKRGAAAHYESALALYREVGDEHGEHTATANLARTAFDEGRFEDFVERLCGPLAAPTSAQDRSATRQPPYGASRWERWSSVAMRMQWVTSGRWRRSSPNSGSSSTSR